MLAAFNAITAADIDVLGYKGGEVSHQQRQRVQQSTLVVKNKLLEQGGDLSLL